jgi:hypothetical protein
MKTLFSKEECLGVATYLSKGILKINMWLKKREDVRQNVIFLCKFFLGILSRVKVINNIGYTVIVLL